VTKIGAIQGVSKISIDDGALMDKDVLWFDVFVSDSLLVHESQATSQAPKCSIDDLEEPFQAWI
jgi:hypothetical protein